MEQRQHSATVHQLEEPAHDAKPGEFMFWVHDLSQQRLMAGQPREELLHDLEVFRGLLRDMGREDLEDDVLDVMDFVTGWCAPSARL
jgi:hypothetical protein